MDFLKISPVFTYCYTLYPNIPLEHYYMICFSRLGIIVCRKSGFMILKTVSDNLIPKKCTETCNTHVGSVIGYLYYIVFDQGILSICDYFNDRAARERINLESSSVYQPQTDIQSENTNKEILQTAQACQVEGNEWLNKLSMIQLNLNSPDNSARLDMSFFLHKGFRAKDWCYFLPIPDHSIYLRRRTSSGLLMEPILLPSQARKISQQEAVHSTTSFSQQKGSSFYREPQPLVCI